MQAVNTDGIERAVLSDCQFCAYFANSLEDGFRADGSFLDSACTIDTLVEARLSPSLIPSGWGLFYFGDRIYSQPLHPCNCNDAETVVASPKMMLIMGLHREHSGILQSCST